MELDVNHLGMPHILHPHEMMNIVLEIFASLKTHMRVNTNPANHINIDLARLPFARLRSRIRNCILIAHLSEPSYTPSASERSMTGRILSTEDMMASLSLRVRVEGK
jgi:hypothetical protein